METQRWVLLLILILLAISSSNIVEAMSGKSQCTAMYVFGDSISDPGNNKYFRMFFLPYGIDYDEGPTGRFTNGKLLVDFLGELLGFPVIPSYVDTVSKGADILSGVNYASAGMGILDGTGYHFGLLYVKPGKPEKGLVFPFSAQVENFKSTVNQLETQMSKKKLRKYLSKAVAVVALGVNDYVNNYFFPLLYNSSKIYNPQDYADLLIKTLTGHLMELQRLGIRKFFVTDVIPVGCTPNSVGLLVPGECDAPLNSFVTMFNTRLKSLVHRLNSHKRSIFVCGSLFQSVTELRDNAPSYGFKVTDEACCGNRTMTCSPNVTICGNRNEYLFWDFAHLTESANQILARRFYEGTSSNLTFPVNIKQMTRMTKLKTNH